ncbi:F0F1 ATP synthase subunit delta [Campylobacter sp. FMV-PI01]|uniref:ATP synthase subunit delta n=1 Tax=Campylobacter portucalensis TaxID=2608384 RepID=A0A6L5WKW1_9BACT|nr:F0F1 ATP synthase subunit delta [Campylobacter portucalensis]MSN96635.1 F0F1 ATP synthase subunit delta [Campylobacter portucalensis]
MSYDVIAKRYVKALMEQFNEDELKNAILNLENISLAFDNDKFRIIINSPVVDDFKKFEFILMFIKHPFVKFENFIKLLMENKRLVFIPEIYKRIRIEMATLNGEYFGEISSKENLNSEEIRKIEDIFSKKFNAKISLKQNTKEYNGIKISLEELGVEISFSIDRLRQDMNEYILKAI